MLSTIRTLEAQFHETLMNHYRHLHSHPELSYQEVETARYVADELDKLGLDEVQRHVGGHGVLAVLHGNKPGRVVALRADMDALSITQKTGAAFSSKNDGVMHACGHDAHTSILLTTATILSQLREHIEGTVKFVFQPAEECTPHGGAPGMIADGILENPKVQAMIGLHVWPTLPTGRIGMQAGAVSAASDHLKIKVTGKACHASMPDQGVDALVAASSMVMALQTIVSRNVKPHEAVVVTLGTVSGGLRYNIVVNEVSFDGTVRSFNEEIHAQLPQWITRVASGAVSAFGASAEVDYEVGYPPTMNDPRVVSTLQSTVKTVAGPDGLLKDLPVPPSGEEFAFYSCEVPSAFAWLGCRPASVAPDDMPSLHNDQFLPDPDSFALGVCYLCQAVFDLLQTPLEEWS